jgi:hypothetical protein
MTTHYLRFPDELTGMAALAAAGFTATDEDGATVVVTASHSHALDVIGPLWIGGILLEGWHVNYIGTLPDDWQQYIVMPKRPARVFA